MFVFCGKRKIAVNIKESKFLFKGIEKDVLTKKEIKKTINSFFYENRLNLRNKKICVVIPDNTRPAHHKEILPLLSRHLKKVSSRFYFIVALGMHRPLTKSELKNFLGDKFFCRNTVLQHSLSNLSGLGRINDVPAYINANIIGCDVIITLSVVEPHLYAGFSGGVKCIAIGLGGPETILYTHSVEFLNKKGVRIGNIQTNPFQRFIWKVAQNLNKDIYSLNIVNNFQKDIMFISFGEAKISFDKAVHFARDLVSYPVREKFDLVFVGCDYPKEKSFYQASRLFNYMLEAVPVVRRGGGIFVFAGLKNSLSRAEKNFEALLKKENIPLNYTFNKPGEHRAYKVIEASKFARLGIISSCLYKKFPYVKFFKNYKDALSWARIKIKKVEQIAVIPSGFSFLPKNV